MSLLFKTARRLIDVRREQQLRSLWSHVVRVRHRTDVENVYHCCVWKTASQWIRNILSSTDVFRYSGLLSYTYEHHEGRDDRSLDERRIERPFPPRRIITPLYINYPCFEELPKPQNFRAFFVARDPRDLVVSHYFSSRYSHVANPGVMEERAQLEGLNEAEGMGVHMRYMADRGIFAALDTWAEHASLNPQIKLFRFEDLVGSQQLVHLSELLQHCDIRLPQSSLQAITQRLSFKKLSGGRKQGEENKFHKYRSGKAGDWKKYFDDRLCSEFESLADGLIGKLGYA